MVVVVVEAATVGLFACQYMPDNPNTMPHLLHVFIHTNPIEATSTPHSYSVCFQMESDSMGLIDEVHGS